MPKVIVTTNDDVIIMSFDVAEDFGDVTKSMPRSLMMDELLSAIRVAEMRETNR